MVIDFNIRMVISLWSWRPTNPWRPVAFQRGRSLNLLVSHWVCQFQQLLGASCDGFCEGN